jgi:hypothetical protein
VAQAEKSTVGNADQTPVEQEFYRGYRISLFGEDSAWSFKLAPTKIGLPLLERSIFFKTANAKSCALTLAKIEIDRLLRSKAGRSEEAKE